MTAGDRAEAVEQVYGHAVELSGEERARYLDEACAGDPVLRSEVESLLERSADAEALFARLGEAVRIPLDEALPPRFESGDRVGPYAIEGELGRGGMGVVYRARDVRLGRAVALKFLPPYLSADPEAKTRLVAEAKAASATDHPNIATLYEIGEAADGAVYLAMPCYQGETLKQRLTRGPVPPDEARTIARQIAEGLAAAHRHGIIHRDVKPANVFLTEDGFVKLLDFGVAKLAESDVTQPGRAVGTAAYMSPEQARGERVDHRTDLWSLGVVLYEMIAGRRPFRGEREAAVVRAILEDEPPALATPEGIAPPDLARIVRRLLAKDPAGRYGSAAEVARDLAAGPVAPPAVRPRRRPRWALPAIGAVAVALAVAVAVAVLRPGESEVASPEAARTVAVLPFQVRGDDEYAYLREGMVNLLSVSLQGPDLDVVPPTVMLSRTEQQATEPITLEDAARLAEVVGAGRFILGEIVEIEGRLRIQASLYDRDRLDAPVADATVEGDDERLFNLVDELSTQLMLAPHGGPGGRMARAAAASTTSLEAFKAYLDGERSLAAGDFDAAIGALQRATAADTAYALAYYRLAQAAGWDLRYRQAREAALAAQRHGARLAPHERLLVDALVALMERDVAAAERLYYQILSDRPDDVEAWHGLGEVLFHSNHLRGRSRDEARKPFERAVQLDPLHGESRFHLLQMAAWDRRRADFETLYRTLPERERTSLEWRALRAFAFGDSAAQATVVAEMGRAEDRERYRAALRVATYARNLGAGARLARLQIEGARLPEPRMEGLELLARIELARGRPRAARAVLMELAALDPAKARELGAMFAALPFVPVDRSEIDRLQREFAAWRPERGGQTALRSYVLGLLEVRSGDRAGALTRAAELEAMTGEPAADSLARGYAAVLRAYVAFRQGDAAAALEHLEAAPWAIALGGPSAAFYARTLERYLKAEILQALERRDEALGWYRTVAEFSSHGVPYMGPAALREAEHAARAGDEALAVEHYRRFLAMWGGAEPELQPIVQGARRRLTELVGERPAR